jgi:hypothetical protein
MKAGGQSKSRVNEAGNYTKPAMRKGLFEKIKNGDKGGKPGQWSARKAQMLVKQYDLPASTMQQQGPRKPVPRLESSLSVSLSQLPVKQRSIGDERLGLSGYFYDRIAGH